MTATIQEQEFWMQVFLAVRRFGNSGAEYCATQADEAVIELRKRTSLKLPEGEKPKSA